MDISANHQPDVLSFNDHSAFTLEGTLQKNSTENLHVHDSHQILHFNSGISLLLDNIKQQPLFNSMTAFIPAGCPHRSVVLGRMVEYKSLYIKQEMFPDPPVGIRVFDMSELGIALLNRIKVPVFEFLQDVDTNPLQQDCLQLFLKILTKDIERRSAVARLPVASLEQNLLITNYIQTHYRERITLQDFSRILPYTTRHLSRCFKQEMKISIFEYLKIYRILQASIEIETTGKTITEVAYSCGYNSISSFFNDFSQIFSMSPGQFRKRRGGN